MLPASVPEAAMDQDHGVQTCEHNINSNSRHPLVRAVMDAIPPKCRTQPPFGEGVTAADLRHHFAAFGRGPDVGHGITKAHGAFSRQYQGSED